MWKSTTLKKTLCCLFVFLGSVYAQFSSPQVAYVSSAPSGSCSATPPLQVVVSTGAIYSCNNGTWGQSGGSGGASGGTALNANLPYVPTESTTPLTENYGAYIIEGQSSVFPDGTLVITYRQGAQETSNDGVCKLQTSTDQGQTWSAQSTIASLGGADVRACTGGVTPTGRLVLFYRIITSGVFTSQDYIYSDDKGVTWSAPVVMNIAPGTAAQPYGGMIVLGNGVLQASFYSTDAVPTNYSQVTRSTDNGVTWSAPITVVGSTTNQFTEGTFIYLGGSVVFGLLRCDNNNREMEQVISKDNGLTWTDVGAFTPSINTGPLGYNPWLSTYVAPNGRRIVEVIYPDRGAQLIYAMYGEATQLIAGVAGTPTSLGWSPNSTVVVGVPNVATAVSSVTINSSTQATLTVTSTASFVAGAPITITGLSGSAAPINSPASPSNTMTVTSITNATTIVVQSITGGYTAGGPFGAQAGTLTQVSSDNVHFGYPSVVHPNNGAAGIGLYYDWVSTSVTVARFFTVPVNTTDLILYGTAPTLRFGGSSGTGSSSIIGATGAATNAFTFSNPTLVNTPGTVANPAIRIGGVGTPVGLYTRSGTIGFVASGASWLESASTTTVWLSGATLAWASSPTNVLAAADTAFSRDAAGVVDIGTGAQGSKAGSLRFTGEIQVEEAAPAGVASSSVEYADSTQHAMEVNNNSTGAMPISRLGCMSVVPTTVAVSTASDQNLQACSLSANLLNVAGRTLKVFLAGVYSNVVTAQPTVALKIKLCTVSGCGSGVVITPISIVSTVTAATAVSNLAANLTGYISTQTAGASSAYEAHGSLAIDLGTTGLVADSVFADTNTATVGTIDSTGALFLQAVVAFSGASSSNSFTSRQLIVEVLN